MMTKKLSAADEQVCLRRLRQFFGESIDQELIVTVRANLERPNA